jgi:hypothetical protein
MAEEAKATNLTGPEGDKGTEGVTSFSPSLAHFLESSTEGNWEGAIWTCLNFNLCHLEWAKGNICENFSRG